MQTACRKGFSKMPIQLNGSDVSDNHSKVQSVTGMELDDGNGRQDGNDIKTGLDNMGAVSNNGPRKENESKLDKNSTDSLSACSSVRSDDSAYNSIDTNSTKPSLKVGDIIEYGNIYGLLSWTGGNKQSQVICIKKSKNDDYVLTTMDGNIINRGLIKLVKVDGKPYTYRKGSLYNLSLYNIEEGVLKDSNGNPIKGEIPSKLIEMGNKFKQVTKKWKKIL